MSDFKINYPAIENLLFGHVSEETAYQVEDYPYGFRLRCSIRYWIETDKKKGDRFCSQTTNPKVSSGIVWNKAKKSTYSTMMVMYLNEEQHVKCFNVTPYEEKNFPDLMDFLKSIHDKLSKPQMDGIRMWYFYNTQINYGFRLKNYNSEESKAAFTNWTKETVKYISSCAFEDLLKHPQAPKRDGDEHRDGDFYLGITQVA